MRGWQINMLASFYAQRYNNDLAERSKRHYTPLEHIQEQGQRKTGQKRESEGHTSYIHQ